MNLRNRIFAPKAVQLPNLRRSHLALAALQLWFWAVMLAPLCARAGDFIATGSGSVQGVTEGRMTKYLGIPYAAPPTGDLRWKPPQAPKPWEAILNAAAFGNRCPQTAVAGEFSAPSATEDCLFLNVFVPSSGAAGQKLAVMFWIPGGGFFAGGSNDYDPTSLVADGNVIFVSFNYRIGLLGFFAHPGIDAEGNAVANYGLLDQQFALRWVRDNIAAFGGDPDNVTIFGESAGAISVYGHLESPQSKGLFQKAILESGFTDYAASPLANPGTVITSLAEATLLGAKFATAAGCTEDVAACLRRLPVKTIINQQMPFVSGLIIGAPGVPKPFDPVLRDGVFNRVPIINGTNHDEWRWPLARTEMRTGKPLTAEQYLGELTKFFGDAGSKVATEYLSSNFGSPSEALAAAETDAYFSCGAIRNDDWLAAYVPVFGYEFNDADAPMYMPPASFPYGAAHTKELQFIFPMFHGGSGMPHSLTPAESKLSSIMVHYWSNFAKAGDPNGEGLPLWPRLTPTAKNLESLDVPAPSTIGASFSVDHKCAFWSNLLQ